MVGRSDPKVVKGTDEHLKLERLDWGGGGDPVAAVTTQGVRLVQLHQGHSGRQGLLEGGEEELRKM